MIRANITNFRNLRSVALHDDAPVSMVVGRNESGKSSLIEALGFALKGTAFGHKGKDVSKLLTYGETKLQVLLKVGDLDVTRNLSSGDTVKSIAEQLGVVPDVLPLLFDSAIAGDGGNKAMNTFLSEYASGVFEAKDAAAGDPMMLEKLEQARRVGCVTTKKVIEWFTTRRAACKADGAPIPPGVNEVAEADVQKLTAGLAAALERLRAAEALQSEHEGTVALIQRVLAFQTAQAAVLAYRGTSDPLGARRGVLEALAGVNPNAVSTVHRAVQAAVPDIPGLEAQAELIGYAVDATTEARNLAKQVLTGNPLPAAAPPAAVPGAGVVEFLDAMGGIACANEDLLDANRALAEAKAAAQARRVEYGQLSDAIATARKSQGAWEAYRASQRAYAAAKEKAEADWLAWDSAAKRLEAFAEEHRRKAGLSFGAIVAELGKITLNDRALAVDQEHGITLAGVPIGDLSKSTRWRAEVVVMAAVAKTLRSPLLLIDAADILDYENMLDFQRFVASLASNFVHTIVTATPRGPMSQEKPGPAGITKWAMENGSLRKI